MRGYYYPSWPIVGQAQPSASDIFKQLQAAFVNQPSTSIRRLIAQFNDARRAESRYGGLSGSQQFDTGVNRRFPRRLVLWYGRSVGPGYLQGYPLRPIGVFVLNDLDDMHHVFRPFQDAHRLLPEFYGFGFERVSEPLIIWPNT